MVYIFQVSSDSQSTPNNEEKIPADSEKPAPSPNTQLGEYVRKEKASEQESSQVENIQEKPSEDVAENKPEPSMDGESDDSTEEEPPVLSDDQVKPSETIVEDQPQPSKNGSEESAKYTEEESHILSDDQSHHKPEDQSMSKDQSSTDQSYFSAGEDLQDSATESQLISSNQSQDSQTESQIAEFYVSQLGTPKESTTSNQSDVSPGNQPKPISEGTVNTSFTFRHEDGQMHADTLSIPAGQKRIDQFFKPTKKTADSKAKQDQNQQTKLTEETDELQATTADKAKDTSAYGANLEDDKAEEDNNEPKASESENDKDKADNLAESIDTSDVSINESEGENVEEKDESSDDEITFKGIEPEVWAQDDQDLKTNEAIAKQKENKPVNEQEQSNIESTDSHTIQTDTDVDNNLNSIQEETNENTEHITEEQEQLTEQPDEDGEDIKLDTKDTDDDTESKVDQLPNESTTETEEQIDDVETLLVIQSSTQKGENYEDSVKHLTSLIRQSSENAESDSDNLLWDSDSFYGEHCTTRKLGPYVHPNFPIQHLTEHLLALVV